MGRSTLDLGGVGADDRALPDPDGAGPGRVREIRNKIETCVVALSDGFTASPSFLTCFISMKYRRFQLLLYASMAFVPTWKKLLRAE